MKIRNVAIVSLSSGTLGEAFARHELEIGVRRLEDFGLSVRFMPRKRLPDDAAGQADDGNGFDPAHRFIPPFLKYMFG